MPREQAVLLRREVAIGRERLMLLRQMIEKTRHGRGLMVLQKLTG
jgi:hypothetical protein